MASWLSEFNSLKVISLRYTSHPQVLPHIVTIVMSLRDKRELLCLLLKSRNGLLLPPQHNYNGLRSFSDKTENTRRRVHGCSTVCPCLFPVPALERVCSIFTCHPEVMGPFLTDAKNGSQTQAAQRLAPEVFLLSHQSTSRDKGVTWTWLPSFGSREPWRSVTLFK